MLHHKIIGNLIISSGLIGMAVCMSSCTKQAAIVPPREFKVERVETDKGTVLVHFDSAGNTKVVTISKDGEVRTRMNPP